MDVILREVQSSEGPCAALTLERDGECRSWFGDPGTFKESVAVAIKRMIEDQILMGFCNG